MKRSLISICRFFYLIPIMTVMACLGSCSNEKEQEPQVPAVLSIQNCVTEPELVSLLTPNTLKVEIRAHADVHSDQMLTIYFGPAPDYVDKYNAKHGTDLVLLPAEAYTIDSESVLLPRFNESSSTINIEIFSEKIPTAESYLLPITITKVEGSENVELSKENNVHYILVKKKMVKAPELLDQTKFKIVYCSSEIEESNGGIKTGLSKDLIDGDPKTYWTYNYRWKDEATKYVPFYIVVDLGETATVRGVKILARQSVFGDPASNPKFPPKDIRIDLAKTLTSEDGMNDSDWFYSDEHLAIPYAMENDVYLSEMHEARYVRFVYMLGYNKPTTTYKGGSLAEFNVWGNIGDIYE